VRSDAARVFLDWFAAHDRRLGRASLGDALSDPEVNANLCGLDLLRDTRGEILDGEVLRIAACGFSGTPDTGPLTRAHCRQLQQGTYEEATPDELALRPSASSLTRRPDGGFSLSLGSGDVERLERLLRGVCAGNGPGTANDSAALQDVSPELCLDGPMDDVLSYAALSELAADCYSGLSASSASPVPTSSSVMEGLASGSLGGLVPDRSEVLQGILRYVFAQIEHEVARDFNFNREELSLPERHRSSFDLHFVRGAWGGLFGPDLKAVVTLHVPVEGEGTDDVGIEVVLEED
jgi:hypothetical protein